MKSFKQMIADKEIKRADAMKVRLEDIHIEPGFNLRDKDAVDENGMTFQESIDALAEHLAEGGQVPPLEVRPRAEGGVWIVEGERRTLSYRQLDAQGRLPKTPNKDNPEILEFWVSVVPFEGNDADRLARVFTSNTNRRLTDLEKANGCKRLAAFGWTPDQIAKKIGMTRQRVDQLLILANAPTAVQQMVKAGEVSGSVAVDVVRQHGDDAGQVLGGELEKAKAQGKGKVTAGTMKGPSVPRNLLDDLHGATIKLHSSLPMDARLQIDRYHRGEIAEGKVEVDLQHLMELHLILEESQRVLADKELKLREKQNKEAQLELQEGAQ
jgi:hypothetical protein